MAIVCRHNYPVAEIRAIETPSLRPTRIAGCSKGRCFRHPAPLPPSLVRNFWISTAHPSFQARVRCETAARHLCFPLVLSRLARAFTAGASLGNRPQVRPKRTRLTYPPFRAHCGHRSRVGHSQPSTYRTRRPRRRKIPAILQKNFPPHVDRSALMGGMAIRTSDRAFDHYPVRLIW